MKELIAIIQPGKWTATKMKLKAAGVTGYTTCRTFGRGKQKGLQYVGARGEKTGMSMVSKRLVWIWLEDDLLAAAVGAIMDANRTGAIGDGKIFVCPVEDAMRVRTGDRAGRAIL